MVDTCKVSAPVTQWVPTASGGGVLGTHSRVRIPEPLIKYRVRRQSQSNATPSKRRKAALAKLSELPTARPLLLAATCVLHKAFQRPDYVPLDEWEVSKAKA